MNLLIIVLSSQLLYYLLIVQTGVVGSFGSDIHDLYTLPIGGLIGGIVSSIVGHSSLKKELLALFSLQFVISCFYPHYSLVEIGLLGFVTGYTTPRLLFVFRHQSGIALGVGLGIAYIIGTILYSYPYHSRGFIAIILPIISAFALLFTAIDESKNPSGQTEINWKALWAMSLFIFLDSLLFETLSRSGDMNIWDKYTTVIVIFHLLGIVLAYMLSKRGFFAEIPRVMGLFAISYILYLTKQQFALAVIYPLTISYYNFIVFRKIMKYDDIKPIALTMVFMGWVATTVANGSVLEHQYWLAPLLVVFT